MFTIRKDIGVLFRNCDLNRLKENELQNLYFYIYNTIHDNEYSLIANNPLHSIILTCLLK